jgi:hypothetical protein
VAAPILGQAPAAGDSVKPHDSAPACTRSCGLPPSFLVALQTLIGRRVIIFAPQPSLPIRLDVESITPVAEKFRPASRSRDTSALLLFLAPEKSIS